MKQKPTRLSYGLFHTLSHLSEPSRLRVLEKKKEEEEAETAARCPAEAQRRDLQQQQSIHHATYTLLSHSAARVVLCLAHV